jgi:predicted RNA-binding protein with PIN domain
MPLLIDGHNLIPKIPGLNLQDLDDEMQLVELLQQYCLRTHKKVEVFFDNAPPGHAGARRFASVTARFVRAGQTADQAIRRKLMRLGREARNWTVVSSDHEVQAAARAARANIISAERFASLLSDLLREAPGEVETPERSLSAEELDGWLKLFGAGEEDEP